MAEQPPSQVTAAPEIPLQIGWKLAVHWRLQRIRAEDQQARLWFNGLGDSEVEFRLSAPAAASRRGPFDTAELAIAYLKGPVEFNILEPLGKALQKALTGHSAAAVLGFVQVSAARPLRGEIWPAVAAPQHLAALVSLLDPQVVTGLSRVHWSRDESTLLRKAGLVAVDEAPRQAQGLQGPDFVPPLTLDFVPPLTGPEQPAAMAVAPPDYASGWAERARAALTDRPGISLKLMDLLPEAALPSWQCALPWTRLELSQGGFVGPCCVEYQAERFIADRSPMGQWNGAALQRFRTLMTKPGLPTTCRATCPIWQGRSEPVAEVRIVGGPAEAVESQIRTVRSLLAGESISGGAPLAVCLTATSFCNYDCLMCPLGEEGTLSDQWPAEFYTDLLPLLQGVQVLEVNGGEPLASPNFCAFLEQLDRRALPQLRVNLITNGSYLAAKRWERLMHVPWGNLTWSLNAATAATYQLVNRGLPFERIRANLDALAQLRRSGQIEAQVTYSMVVLKQNLHEIELLGELAAQDGACVRLMLPFRNRHDSSILTDRSAMEAALQAMQRLTKQLLQRGRGREARGVLAQARVLWERLNQGVLEPL